MARGWEQDVLDPFQRTKHYQLLRCLKEHPGRWFSVDALDASMLPSGARLASFPSAWLEHMASHMCAGRSSRFEMRDVVDHRAEGGAHDADDRAAGKELSFSIRSVVRAPTNQADLLRYLRYPRAETEEWDDGGEDGQGGDDDYDLAVLSSAFYGSPDATFSTINDACAAGLALAIPLQAQHKAGSSGGGGGMFDALTSSGDGGVAGGGVTAMEERMFQAWWSTCPVAMRASHTHGQRGVTDIAANALPCALHEQDTLALEWRRRVDHPLNRMAKASSATVGNSGAPMAAGTPFVRHYRVHLRAYPASAVGFQQPLTTAATPNDDGWHIAHGARDDWAWFDVDQRVRRIHPLHIKLAPSHHPTTSRPSEVRLHVVIEELIGTATERVGEVQWSMQLLWNPRIERVDSTHSAKGVYALFRKETEPSMALPPSETLACFQPRGSSGASKRTRDGEGAAEGGDLFARRLRESWWASIAPSITRSAQNCRPSEADIAAASAVVVVPVVLHHTLSGAILTLPAAAGNGDDGDASASKKRRRKYRDMRNTHMLHMGLNLQQPYQAHLRFKPLGY